jgi:hypothetical protein
MRECCSCEYMQPLVDSFGRTVYFCMNCDSGAYMNETDICGNCDLESEDNDGTDKN